MKKFSFVLILAIMPIMSLSIPMECRLEDNERYSGCANHCIATCPEPDMEGCTVSKPHCNPGCICEENYVRNARGLCVLEEDCL